MEEKIFGEDYTIEVDAKSVKAGLIQYIVKKYMQTQLFELISPTKFRNEIYNQISENLKYENLSVEVKLVGESEIHIDVLMDVTAVNIHILTTGIPAE